MEFSIGALSPFLAASHSPLATAANKCHTKQSLFTRNPLKTNKTCTKEASHFFNPSEG